MRKPLGFDESLVSSVRVNHSAVERRAATLATRRTFKVEAQAAALLRALMCLDLTTLAGDDTEGRVRRLCAKALNPIRLDILVALGLADLHPTVGAVCVYLAQVKAAAEFLKGRLPIASVATGFPAGQTSLRAKLLEIEDAITDGATEIDVVISRELALTGRWRELYNELLAFRAACGERAKLKVILGVGNLGTLEVVAKASAVAIMAGADTIKTSTGMEPTNATLETGLVMARQIRRFRELDFSGDQPVGFKPAGGIRTAGDVMKWQILMLEELGEAWTHPNLFRVGASALLTDIERQLSHLATGRYAADHHQPLA